MTGAALLLAASLSPSLLPRGWVAQGVVAGVAAAVGYGLGSLIARLSRRLFPGISQEMRARMGAACTLLTSGVAGWSLYLHHQWQLDVRRLMNADTDIALYPLGIGLIAILSGYAAVQVGRLLAQLHGWQIGRLRRLADRRVARAVDIVVLGVLLVLVLDKVVGEVVFSAVEDAAIAADSGTAPGLRPPQSPYRSGGDDSLVPWDELGVQGKTFVSSGPSTEEIERLTGEPATEPIRVYAGLASGETAAQRAQAALAELERLDAFDRDILVIVIPTGTGWVDDHAVAPLEYMYGGRTAAVAIQYSYRPSWIQLLGNQDVAREASAALFEAISTRLGIQPQSSRPLLLIYGQSLGVFGAESLFSGPEDLQQKVDGILWAGPPRFNRLWKQLTDERDPGSPVWQPVYRDGRHIRFGADLSALLEPGGAWEEPRVVYLQHPSDPVTWWTPALLFDRPEWLDDPRGDDVSDRTLFLPIVTFLQVTVDLMMSASAPVEHGHRFGAAQAEAWTAIAPPENWSPDMTRRLLSHMKANEPNDDHQ